MVVIVEGGGSDQLFLTENWDIHIRLTRHLAFLVCLQQLYMSMICALQARVLFGCVGGWLFSSDQSSNFQLPNKDMRLPLSCLNGLFGQN